MNEDTFQYILQHMEDNPVFINSSSLQQTPVHLQLAVCLHRYGNRGGRPAHSKLARDMGIGEGTVALFSDRVMLALLVLKSEVVHWPNAEEKAVHKQRVCAASCDVFLSVIGFIDETFITICSRD